MHCVPHENWIEFNSLCAFPHRSTSSTLPHAKFAFLHHSVGSGFGGASNNTYKWQSHWKIMILHARQAQIFVICYVLNYDVFANNICVCCEWVLSEYERVYVCTSWLTQDGWLHTFFAFIIQFPGTLEFKRNAIRHVYTWSMWTDCHIYLHPADPRWNFGYSISQYYYYYYLSLNSICSCNRKR